MVADKGHFRAGGWGRSRSRNVALITSARRSPLQDWHRRRKLYVILQLSRLPLLAASGLLMWWTQNLWISTSVALVSLPLPWIAVLVANEKGDGDSRSHKVYKPQMIRQQRAALAQAHQEAQRIRGHGDLRALAAQPVGENAHPLVESGSVARDSSSTPGNGSSTTPKEHPRQSHGDGTKEKGN